jgi:glycosyltransferase involved in cell wall biosynthesis
MPGKVAYIMSRFPHLPETFILREMIAVECLGWQVALYPLVVQQQAVVHAEAQPWLERANRIAWISPEVLAANLRALVRAPGRYLGAWARTLWENGTSLNFLVRAVAILPKAVCMGERMRAEGIDHIHAHYATHPALAAWVIHRLTGIPYSVTVHAHDIFVDKAMLTTKLSSAAFIDAISGYNKEYLSLNCSNNLTPKTQVIHCGIEPGLYHPRRDRQDRFTILSIGSLQPYKGQEVLIEACRLLAGRGLDFVCRIVGDGELRSDLQAQIAAAGLTGRVELAGPRTQQEVAGLLEAADCYVQPSVITPSGKMEGIPVALMEALACELPCVASRLSGIPELIRDGETGLLVEPRNPAALAEAIERLRREPQLGRRLGRAGHSLVLREFDLSTNAARLAELFEGSLSKR